MCAGGGDRVVGGGTGGEGGDHSNTAYTLEALLQEL